MDNLFNDSSCFVAGNSDFNLPEFETTMTPEVLREVGSEIQWLQVGSDFSVAIENKVLKI